MLCRIFIAVIALLFIMDCACSAETGTPPAPEKLKALVRIGVSSGFKVRYRDKEKAPRNPRRDPRYKDEQGPPGKLEAFEIQERLAEAVTKELTSHKMGDVFEFLFIDDDEDLAEKGGQHGSYICLYVILTGREQLEKKQDRYELDASVQIYKPGKTEWQPVFKTKLRAKGSDPEKSGPLRNDIREMARQLDAVLMNNLVPFQIVNSMAKDRNTKIINVIVLNTTRFEIRSIKWMVPDRKARIQAITQNTIKPGEKGYIKITAKSLMVHTYIHWRNATIAEIQFARPSH